MAAWLNSWDSSINMSSPDPEVSLNCSVRYHNALSGLICRAHSPPPGTSQTSPSVIMVMISMLVKCVICSYLITFPYLSSNRYISWYFWPDHFFLELIWSRPQRVTQQWTLHATFFAVKRNQQLSVMTFVNYLSRKPNSMSPVSISVHCIQQINELL